MARDDLFLEQTEVKMTFLQGDLEEEIYMMQPQGFKVISKEKMVCKLKKSLYNLEQAPRQWYEKSESFIGSSGFLRCQAYHCYYVKNLGNSFIILLLYVDNMLIAGGCKWEIDKLKGELFKEFEMKDLGVAKQIIGMRITRNSGMLRLSQE